GDIVFLGRGRSGAVRHRRRRGGDGIVAQLHRLRTGVAGELRIHGLPGLALALVHLRRSQARQQHQHGEREDREAPVHLLRRTLARVLRPSTCRYHTPISPGVIFTFGACLRTPATRASSVCSHSWPLSSVYWRPLPKPAKSPTSAASIGSLQPKSKKPRAWTISAQQPSTRA